MKLNGFNEDIALEFSQTLFEGKSMVKGMEVLATEEIIAEVTGFPSNGENYPASRDTKSARAEYTKPGNPPLSVDK